MFFLYTTTNSFVTMEKSWNVPKTLTSNATQLYVYILNKFKGAHHLANETNQVSQVCEPVNGVQLVHLVGYLGDRVPSYKLSNQDTFFMMSAFLVLKTRFSWPNLLKNAWLDWLV